MRTAERGVRNENHPLPWPSPQAAERRDNHGGFVANHGAVCVSDEITTEENWKVFIVKTLRIFNHGLH